MADTKISALTDGTTAEATDRIPVARSPFASGDNRYVTPAYIKDYILGLANTWTAKQTFTPPANTEAIVVSGFSLTGANAQSLLDLSGTWNTTGTPTAFKLNITDTASNANSLLMNLQVGGSSKFNVKKDGALSVIGVKISSISGIITTDSGSPHSGFHYQFGTTGGVGIGFNNSGLTGFKNGLFNGPGNVVAWGVTQGFGSAQDLQLARDAAYTLAQHLNTNPQTYNLYATRTSSSDYHRSAWSTAKQTLSAVSGASVTATGLIPDGAIVVGVTTKVTTALGTSNGTTGYTVGDGSDADRWGAITGTAAGTSSDNRDWTATTVQAFTSAQDVVITATGGNFDGTGAIEVTVHYLRGEAD